MSEADITLLVILVLASLVIIITRAQNRTLNQRLLEAGIERRNVQLLLEQMKRREGQLHLVADIAFDALMIVDSDKQVTLINKTARDLFHAPSGVALTLLAVTRQHELAELVDEIFSSGEALESQIEIKDRTFRVRSELIRTPQMGVILVMQDITELIRLTRARRDMVANFSHDLRTPIASIGLLVEDLTRRYGRKPDKDREILGKLAGQADNLKHMTEELIDLSMIESGQSIVRMVPVNFADILHGALDVMSTQIEQKKITMTNHAPPELRVLIDPEQTKRVLTNIIHNAIKFTPVQGTIDISTTCDETFSTVCIRDNGPGIPPQDRTRIFERFYQVDTARTGQAGGSGLGLSIAKHIVEAQGGRIWAEAAIPQGASLCFTIPLDEDRIPQGDQEVIS